ncbi:uncharacterized protein LOC121268333 [Juglans microcarpa x Juglans regia]|uniref:uncharacterized protein LOC121268333 n=1 Tax=Juglans microcarpa x Juglans regia TaxID=2249226 RepID=UPI001B7EE45E|nr:uncharacterized protein LOC121268333 [Juglans microcarpa x Juglans regia]
MEELEALLDQQGDEWHGQRTKDQLRRSESPGYTGGGTTSSARRAHVRRARYKEVFTTYRAAPGPKSDSREAVITFSEMDEECMLRSHDDALVVTMQITSYLTWRVLIDNGSSVNIIFWEAFIRMGITPYHLLPTPTPLKGFSGDVIQRIRAITLSILVGMTATMVDFLVVKAPSFYNAIQGHPTLNHLKVRTSTYHLKLKFSTPMGVREICSN